MRIRWRNLELPNRVSIDHDTFSDTYGRFSVEPFERGFGHSIGNGLRRVLLSSLEGTAVVWLKIEGVDHEFEPLEDVVEDVTDIVLTMKQMRVVVPGDGPLMMKLDVTRDGAVTAGDFVPESDAEIANPDLHICTLSKSRRFAMEVEVRKGRGYVTAEENEYGSFRGASKTSRKEVDQEIGKIWVDSTYSPVLRCRYRTEDTRVGKLTDYDNLILEVWTNGTVRPDYALVEASKIYRKHLNPLVAYDESGGEMSSTDEVPEPAQVEMLQEEDNLNSMMSMAVSELDFSVRSNNCLEAERIATLGDLVQRTEADLLNVRNFGKTSLKEINAKLEELGLHLGMTVTQ